jgi:glycerophosphoryl diester phosphodiesterase
MDSTRRTILSSVTALALAGCHREYSVTDDLPPPIPPRRPIIIAHRGASGERPEHTLASYRLGIEQGADFIEPDLVMTKDGHLVCRHENEISGTTDVASSPEFAARKTVKIIDGERFEGWFTEDFTLAELKTLRCRERLPQLRPANTAFDGQEAIPTLEEVIALAKAAGRPVGIYPETKHPTHHERLGLSFDRPLLAALNAARWNSVDAPVFIQSFEVNNLKRLSALTQVPLIQLMSAEGGPPDLSDVTYAGMASPDGLQDIARYARGIGPQKSMILPATMATVSDPPTALVVNAHAVGLKVHPWTFRAENNFLPPLLRQGTASDLEYLRRHGDMVAEVAAFLRAGVDGVFADHVALAVAGRAQFLSQAGAGR